MKLAAAIPIISTFASFVLATGTNVITMSGSGKDGVVKCGDTVYLEGTFYGQHDTDKFYYGLWVSYNDDPQTKLGSGGVIYYSSDGKTNAPEKTDDGYKFTFSTDIKVHKNSLVKKGKHLTLAYISPQQIFGVSTISGYITSYLSDTDKEQFATNLGTFPVTDKSKAITLEMSNKCTE